MERKQYTIDELLAKFIESPPPEKVSDKSFFVEECRFPFGEYFYPDPSHFVRREQTKYQNKQNKYHNKRQRYPKAIKIGGSEDPQPIPDSNPKNAAHTSHASVGALPPGFEDRAREIISKNDNAIEESQKEEKEINDNNNEKQEENNAENEKEVIPPPTFSPKPVIENIIYEENNDKELIRPNIENVNNNVNDNGDLVQKPEMQAFEQSAYKQISQPSFSTNNNAQEPIFNTANTIQEPTFTSPNIIQEPAFDNVNSIQEPSFNLTNSIKEGTFNPTDNIQEQTFYPQNLIKEPAFNTNSIIQEPILNNPHLIEEHNMDNLVQQDLHNEEQQDEFASVLDHKISEPEIIPPPINSIAEAEFPSVITDYNKAEEIITPELITNKISPEKPKETQYKPKEKYTKNKFAPYVPGESKQQNPEKQSFETRNTNNKSNPFAPYIPRSIPKSDPVSKISSNNTNLSKPEQENKSTTFQPTTSNSVNQDPRMKASTRTASYNGMITQMPQPQPQQYVYPPMQAVPMMQNFNYNPGMMPFQYDNTAYQAQQMYQYNQQIYNQRQMQFQVQQQHFNAQQMYPQYQTYYMQMPLQAQQQQIQQMQPMYSPFGTPQFTQMPQPNQNMIHQPGQFPTNPQEHKFSETQESFGFNSVLDSGTVKKNVTQNQTQRSSKVKEVILDEQPIESPIKVSTWESINSTPAPDFKNLMEQEQKKTITPADIQPVTRKIGQEPDPSSFVDSDLPKQKRGNESRRGERRSHREKIESSKPQPIDINMFMTNIIPIDSDNRPKLEYNNGDKGVRSVNRITHLPHTAPSIVPSMEGQRITQLGFASSAFSSPEITQMPQTRDFRPANSFPQQIDPSQIMNITRTEAPEPNRRSNYNPNRSQRKGKGNRYY